MKKYLLAGSACAVACLVLLALFIYSHFFIRPVLDGIPALLALYFWEKRSIADSGEVAYDYENGKLEVFFDGDTYLARDDLDVVLLVGIDKFADQLTAEDVRVNYQQAVFPCSRFCGHCRGRLQFEELRGIISRKFY